MQNAVLQVALLREQAVDEARQTDGAVVVTERDDSVGERRVARVGKRCRPRVGAAAEARELEGERAQAGSAGRDSVVVALRAERREHERPVHVRRSRIADEVTREAQLQPGGRRGRVGRGAVQPHRRRRERRDLGVEGGRLRSWRRARLGPLGQRRTCDVGFHRGDLLRGRGRGRARHGPRDGRGGLGGHARGLHGRAGGCRLRLGLHDAHDALGCRGLAGNAGRAARPRGAGRAGRRRGRPVLEQLVHAVAGARGEREPGAEDGAEGKGLDEAARVLARLRRLGLQLALVPLVPGPAQTDRGQDRPGE